MAQKKQKPKSDNDIKLRLRPVKDDNSRLEAIVGQFRGIPHHPPEELSAGIGRTPTGDPLVWTIAAYLLPGHGAAEPQVLEG